MDKSLSKPTIILHWLTGLLFIGVLAFGLYVEEMPRGPEKFEMLALHKSFGFTVLVIALIRLFWRLFEGEISHVAKLTPWQDMLAKGTHMLLLIGTLLMPISGIMMSVGGGHGLSVFGFEIFAKADKIEWMGNLGHDIHGPAAWVLIAAILLHVIGALKHQFFDKDGTLARMLGAKVKSDDQ
ncbi:cytochrome b [Pseudoalteromonas pernae]|uniref:cytochrome b n=1 Tax=Pseudoalteromonas pernae TaxID=3118054 RepID=UPI003242D309